MNPLITLISGLWEMFCGLHVFWILIALWFFLTWVGAGFDLKTDDDNNQ